MDEPSARGQSDGLYRGRSQSLSAGSGRSQRRGEHLQVLSDGHCSREGEGSASTIKIIRLLESTADTATPTPDGPWVHLCTPARIASLSPGAVYQEILGTVSSGSRGAPSAHRLNQACKVAGQQGCISR